MTSFTFETCHKIVCEPGAIKTLPSLCKDLGMHRIVLVTDAGLVSAGLIQPVTDALDAEGLSIAVYDAVQADPPDDVVLAAAKFARDHDADGVIGLGGGSSMDVAKLISVLKEAKQPLSEMYGVGNINVERLPLVQVPTTAGTGSEVTPISIITTGETTKMGVVSPCLLPDVALLDANLTTGLPPHVTAATGIDAMVHAIEAYMSKIKKNPYSDMLARQALTLMSRHIVDAVDDGDNVDARQAMLLGAMMAGQAFANAPVGAVHALAYPLGGHYHIPHGLSNSLVLPPVLRFNACVAEPLYAELLPAVSGDSYSAASDGCEAFITHMEQLITRVKLPTTLEEMAIQEQDLPMLASDAMEQQRLLINNPRDVSETDALAIYNEIYT